MTTEIKAAEPGCTFPGRTEKEAEAALRPAMQRMKEMRIACTILLRAECGCEAIYTNHTQGDEQVVAAAARLVVSKAVVGDERRH